MNLTAPASTYWSGPSLRDYLCSSLDFAGHVKYEYGDRDGKRAPAWRAATSRSERSTFIRVSQRA